MKKIIKYLMVVFFASSFLNSCETTDLNLQVSPNELSPTQGDPNLILNAVQLAYGSSIQTFNNIGASLTRIEYFFGRNYFAQYPGGTFSGVWERTYASGTNLIGDTNVDVGIFTNLTALETIDAASADVDLSFHIALGKTLQAHMLLLLVDYLGTAAFSQANSTEFPAPMLDDGASVYAAALGLLDEAEALFATEPSTGGAVDFFYDGDTDQWIRLINSLRLRSFLNTGDSAAFNAVIAGDNFISDTADDFQFQFGTNQLQPDFRHPDYRNQYTPTGARQYRSNWLMAQMQTDGINAADPRIRYYFYRQRAATPGAEDSDGPDEQDLVCSLAVPPLHYAGFNYCFLEEGYWGRSHGNNEGGPPDNFLRTATAVYPAGGRFDDSTFENVGLGVGGAGAGIEPIVLASYVDFWQGQNAIATGGDAAPFLRAGMEKSVAKVQSFADLDSGADLSLAPDEAQVAAFVDRIVAEYSAATGDDQMNVFAEQYFIASYGAGAEPFNFYRRTGFPTTLAPNWEENPGPLPRTFLLPQSEVITNTNLTQRTDLSTQVFWDTNPPGPAFPASN